MNETRQAMNRPTPPKKQKPFKRVDDEKAWLRKMVIEITNHFRAKPALRHYSDLACLGILKDRVDMWGDVLWQGPKGQRHER